MGVGHFGPDGFHMPLSTGVLMERIYVSARLGMLYVLLEVVWDVWCHCSQVEDKLQNWMLLSDSLFHQERLKAETHKQSQTCLDLQCVLAGFCNRKSIPSNSDEIMQFNGWW